MSWLPSEQGRIKKEDKVQMLILAFVFLWCSLSKDKKYLKKQITGTHSANISQFDYSVPKVEQMSTAFTNGLLLKINRKTVHVFLLPHSWS